MGHPHEEAVTHEVEEYFLAEWKFPNEKARKTFLNAGFSRVTCLYFPLAKDDRVHFACRLLTLLFLIDGKRSLARRSFFAASVRVASCVEVEETDLLEDMSFADGKAYNDRLMPIMRGEMTPDRKCSVPVIEKKAFPFLRQSFNQRL